MGILVSAALAAVLLAGCYDPALEDCTVTCEGPDDCADGQVCGGDGFCAQPAVAGTCEGTPVMAALTIHIEKQGRVVIDDPVFSCDAPGSGRTCTTMVPRTGTIDLHAVRTDNDFDRWTTAQCAGQPETCHLTLTGAETIDVGAKFH